MHLRTNVVKNGDKFINVFPKHQAEIEKVRFFLVEPALAIKVLL